MPLVSLARMSRLILRSVADDDQDDIAALNARPEVIDRIGRIALPPADRWNDIRVIQVDGAFAGIVGLIQSDADRAQHVEVFCALLAAFERRGIGKDACAMLLGQATLPSPDTRILACVAEDNAPGSRLAAGLGFSPTRRRRGSGEVIWERLAT